MTDGQENAGPVQPLIPSESDDSGEGAMKGMDNSDSEVKDGGLNLRIQEESAETSGGGARCAGWQGTGAWIWSSRKPLGGGREHRAGDK